MEEATRKPRRRAPLTETDPAYAAALAVIEDRRFTSSSLQAERDCPVCQSDIEDALEEYARAFAPEKAASEELEALYALCLNRDGLIVRNPVLKHFEDKYGVLHDRYAQAQEALNTALEVELVVCITEALELVGITDRALMAEVCRCVVCGGTLLDGQGFMEGQGPEAKLEEAKATGETCPHCGEVTDPDSLRCPICRRFLREAA